MFDYGLSRAVASSLRPRAQITWQQQALIWRNWKIWQNPDSIVHRLPEHFKQRYWRNVIASPTPVHYEMPTSRFVDNWNKRRNYPIETEHHPIVVLYPPESQSALWGGEGIVKGYRLSNPYVKKKVLPLRWIPRLWFPQLQHEVLYSEILNRYMKITVTPRTLNLIDECHGFDNYILGTPEYDIKSAMGNKLKREMLIALAKKEHGPNLPESRRKQMADRYASHTMPLSEAEWVGFSLNEACAKLQDDDDDVGHEAAKDVLQREQIEKTLEEHA